VEVNEQLVLSPLRCALLRSCVEPGGRDNADNACYLRSGDGEILLHPETGHRLYC
jgi:hypothetical protein